MKHLRLFDLRVRHDFYGDGRCPDLELRPRSWHPSGERALARHRLVARVQPDGLEIVAPVDAGGKPVIGLEPGLVLGFDVRVVARALPQYTRLDGWTGARPVYRNHDASGGPLAPVTSELRPPTAVAAGLEVVGATAAWLAAPPTFTLELQARENLWVYYLLTSRSDDAAPEIADGDGQRALGFSRELLSPATATAQTDPVGAGLLARHPERRCWRMISRRAIACRHAPLRQLSLRLGDELLIRELTSPSIHDQTTIKVEPSAAPQQSLYCVIEY